MVACASTSGEAGTSTTYIREEFFLGAIRGIALDEKRMRDRVTRVSYELNVIDGWVRVRERTDESGVIWEGQSRVQSRVRAVLDAAPERAEFIAESHLLWVKTLAKAGRSRQAAAQLRALRAALKRHGLVLKVSPDVRAT